MENIQTDNSLDSFGYYLTESKRYVDIGLNAEMELIRKAQSGDQDAITKIIANNQAMVKRYAKKYISYSGDQDFMDLVQFGNLGLLHAIEKFDTTKGYRFSTYAFHVVMSYTRRGAMIYGSTVKPSHGITPIIANTYRKEDEFVAEHKRYPTPEELAQLLGTTTENVGYSIEVMRNSVSLNRPSLHGDEESDSEIIDDLASTNDHIEDVVIQKELTADLFRSIEDLEPNLKQIIIMSFGLANSKKMTFKEIANELNLSENEVERYKSQAIKTLKKSLLSEDKKKSNNIPTQPPLLAAENEGTKDKQVRKFGKFSGNNPFDNKLGTAYGYYIEERRNNPHKGLSKEREKELIYLAQQGDKEALNDLVMDNQASVISIAKKYMKYAGDQELIDLIQWGNLGLLRAIEKFDLSRNYRLSTYSFPVISSFIRRGATRFGHSITPTFNVSEKLPHVSRKIDEFYQENNQDPTNNDISKIFGIDHIDTELLIQSYKGLPSLDQPLKNQKGESYQDLLDVVYDKKSSFTEMEIILNEKRTILVNAISSLSPEKNKIIDLYFGFSKDIQKTTQQISYILKLSENQVSCLLHDALTEIKTSIPPEYRSAGNLIFSKN